MKIAMIATSFLPIPASKGGAVEILMTDLLEQIKEEDGLIIDVFNNCEKTSNLEKKKFINYFFLNNSFIDNSIDYFRKIIKYIFKKVFKKNIYIKTRFIDKLSKKYDLNSYDMLLIEGSPHQILQLRKIYHGKIVLHVHTTMQFTNKTPYAKNIFTSCNYVLANSEFVKNRIIEIDPQQKNKILIFKNCIKLDNFGKEKYNQFRKEYRKKLGIKNNEKLLLYSGRIVPEKGIKELLLAMEKNNNSKLLIIGGNFFKSTITENYFKELQTISNKLQDRIIFEGYINHDLLPKYIFSCDIAIVPSLCEEAAGLVAIEALASGLPVIATNMGGLPEYVDSNAGIIVKNDENLIKNLSMAINDLTLNDDLFNAKRKNAKKSVAEYDVTKYYENFLKILEEIK